MFSTCLGNLLLISSNSKLSSANSFSLEESNICRLVMVNPSTHCKFFYSSLMKAFVNNFNMVQRRDLFSRMVENILGKRNNGWLPAFSLFQKCFYNSSSWKLFKFWLCCKQLYIWCFIMLIINSNLSGTVHLFVSFIKQSWLDDEIQNDYTPLRQDWSMQQKLVVFTRYN